MTKFLLEDVYGSLGNQPDEKPHDVVATAVEETETNTGFLPSVYMIRRQGELDTINFEFFRYENTTETRPTNSRGMIEIELIETSSEGLDGSVSKQVSMVKDTNEVAKDYTLDDQCEITASLRYKELPDKKNQQTLSTVIPGGGLHSVSDSGEVTTLVSDQLYFNKPLSPVKFRVALDSDLSEKLWSLYEESEIQLELTINWLLRGEENGEPFKQRITQEIPILTSMVAQRRSFQKYETWADTQHDYAELNAQCFSFLMDKKHGLSSVQIIALVQQGSDVSEEMAVTFDQSDTACTQVMTFPVVAGVEDSKFMINTVYNFSDGRTEQTGYLDHSLRYFDATYKAKQNG